MQMDQRMADSEGRYKTSYLEVRISMFPHPDRVAERLSGDKP